VTAAPKPTIGVVGNAARARFVFGQGSGDAGSERLRRDPGTGLLDLQGLTSHLRAMTGDGRDDAQSTPFGVVLLNVESVLTIARNLGRDLYENVISVAASILSEAFGPNKVARLTGEEFVIIWSVLDESRWSEAAQRIVGLLSGPIEVSGIPFDLNPAAGVALFPQHGRDFGTLVAKAELAMIEARRSGEAARLYRRQNLAVQRRRRDLLTDVREMLRDPRREAEISVAYQPQVELRTNRYVGVEALLRWTHPEWGAINTLELVEAIEQSEVMHLVTARVIGIVTSQLGAWKRQGMPTRASINVSVNDIHRENFINDIDSGLTKNDLEPAQLTVEMTEGMLISDPGRVQRAAERIRALGVGLSLDDFGTGYASIRQLRQLPLTEVKIDRLYVNEMLTDPKQRAIISAIYELGRLLQLDVVAEGVEDAETVGALEGLPHVIGQGWHIGYPMAPEALARWWQARNIHMA
jgi:diguanylate cyclase (GGDEF)-like protein